MKDNKYLILIIGAKNTGKTAILKNIGEYVNNNFKNIEINSDNKNYISISIGIGNIIEKPSSHFSAISKKASITLKKKLEFNIKIVSIGKSNKIKYDEEYIQSSEFNGMDAGILTCNISKWDSLYYLKRFLRVTSLTTIYHIPLYLVGTKIDVISRGLAKRQVSLVNLDELKVKYNLSYSNQISETLEWEVGTVVFSLLHFLISRDDDQSEIQTNFRMHDNQLIDINDIEPLKDIESELGRSLIHSTYNDLGDSFYVINRKVISLDVYTDEMEKIPFSIGNLKNLLILSIDGNNLASFPHRILGIKTLRKLSISSPRIREIPNEIDLLTDLRILRLDFSEIKTIPSSIKNLKKLKVLSLNDNPIDSLPEEIGELEYIYKIDLGGVTNDIILPKSIIRLKTLKKLNITTGIKNANENILEILEEKGVLISVED